MVSNPERLQEERESEKELRKIVPFVKSWRQLYSIVLAELFVLILFFFWFSRHFA